MSGSPLAAPAPVFVPRGAASRRFPVLRVLQWFNLDIVAGVLCAAAFAASACGATMPAAWWILLPLVTWIVYAADRLLDARRMGAAAQQERHRFYHEHRRVLAALVGIAAVGAIGGAWTALPRSLLVPAAILGVLAIGHLALAQRPRFALKELSTASIYVAGVWFGPLSTVEHVPAHVWLFVGLHALAATANLLAFALFEEPFDVLDGQTSIVGARGRAACGRLLGWLTAAGALGAGLAMAWPAALPRIGVAVLLALIVLPWAMVRLGGWFEGGQRYRTLGDLAFLLLILAA